MEAYKLRVINEKNDLDMKIKDLSVFIKTKFIKTLSSDEQDRLNHQLKIMQEYSDILKQRINHF